MDSWGGEQECQWSMYVYGDLQAYENILFKSEILEIKSSKVPYKRLIDYQSKYIFTY